MVAPSRMVGPSGPLATTELFDGRRDVAGVPGEVDGGDPDVLPVRVPRPGIGPGDEGRLPRRRLVGECHGQCPRPSRAPCAVSCKETFSEQVLVQLVPAPVDDVGHEGRRLELARHAGTAQAASVRGSADHSRTWRPSAAAESASAMVCSLKGRFSRACRVAEASVDSSSIRADRVRGVGLADVLVVEQELVDVGRAHHLTRGGRDRAGHLEQVLEPRDVDGEDPVDALARGGLPHAAARGPFTSNCGVRPRFRQSIPGQEPAPPGFEVTAGRTAPREGSAKRWGPCRRGGARRSPW